MRVSDPAGRCIGFRLNILGIRVWKEHCQLVARDGSGCWRPLGPPRSLPVHVPADPKRIGSDTLVLTLYQYDRERPGPDLLALLAQKKDFEIALSQTETAPKSANRDPTGVYESR